jgi:uncharacterized protein (DUF305 family)
MDHSNHSMEGTAVNKYSNPCSDSLTDLEFLEHMIPHHQVAIVMSNLLIPKSTNPIILHLCRDIIRKQSYEIWEMSMLLEKPTDYIASTDTWIAEDIITKLDIYNPIMSKSKEGECNPLFFKPNDHSAHMKGMEITDKSYLEHMIPHHQVAVTMSRRLLLHTNNNYLIEFCRKLIIDQQGEILYMNNLLMNTYNYQSSLV